MICIDIKKRLGDHCIQANLHVSDVGITALYGHSGAGKTSIIQMVAGLSAPDAGKIVINNQIFFDSESHIDIPPEQRGLGYIFQDKRLFNFMSVRKNLLFSGRTDEQSPLFTEVVELLDIGHLLTRRPFLLSGGEAQRVAIGRALLSQPDLLLMDEPMSYLDNRCRHALMDYLRLIPNKLGVPIILVTHAVDEIERLADHLFLIENGQTQAGIISSDEISRVLQQLN